MSTKKTSTEVAVLKSSDITLDNVPNLLQLVNQQIEKLKGNREKNVRITESLGTFGVVSQIKDLAVLRGAYAYVTKKLEAIESFNKMFSDELSGQTMPEVKENGYSLSQWQNEIIAQAQEATFATKLEKLEATRKILMENVSKEQKFQESMKDVMSLLTS